MTLETLAAIAHIVQAELRGREIEAARLAEIARVERETQTARDEEIARVEREAHATREAQTMDRIAREYEAESLAAARRAADVERAKEELAA